MRVLTAGTPKPTSMISCHHDDFRDDQSVTHDTPPTITILNSAGLPYRVAALLEARGHREELGKKLGDVSED